MKDMKRALRRHHATRLKTTRRFYWGLDLRREVRHIGKIVNTPCPCSCWMCGNPRKYLHERTRPERVGQFNHAEQLLEALTSVDS